MPVSLLTPIAGALGISEGLAGYGIAISGAFALLTSLSISRSPERESQDPLVASDRADVRVGMGHLLCPQIHDSHGRPRFDRRGDRWLLVPVRGGGHQAGTDEKRAQGACHLQWR
jgi:hypothetical protein